MEHSRERGMWSAGGPQEEWCALWNERTPEWSVCPGAGWAVVELGRTLSGQVEKIHGSLEYRERAETQKGGLGRREDGATAAHRCPMREE